MRWQQAPFGCSFWEYTSLYAKIFRTGARCGETMSNVRVLLLFVISAACVSQSDTGIPPEVKFKSGYVSPIPKPANFTSAMLWGIAIADTRVPGFEKAQVEIAETRLSCRVDGRDVVLNDDR